MLLYKISWQLLVHQCTPRNVLHTKCKFGSFSSVINLVGHLPKELEIISMANDRDSLLFVRGKQGDKK